jgi:selenium-binding protein 1
MAMMAAKEKLVYTVLIYAGSENLPDRLATIDVDPESPTFSQVIHQLPMPYSGDELHHFGWNTCSSCVNDTSKVRRFLIMPGLKSSRVYIVDTLNPREPKMHKIIEPEEIMEKVNLSAPHTVHCLASGKVMISFLGDRNGKAPGGFLQLDEQFNVIGTWGQESEVSPYDFWYQPYHNIMVSSEWATPSTYFDGFKPEDVEKGLYGRKIHFWDWDTGKIVKDFDLGVGSPSQELRFHHNPKSTHGFVGAALTSAIWHWWKDTKTNEWEVEKIIQTEPVDVKGDDKPVPSLITDILLSMDDKYLYLTNWFHGDIRQYDITDPHKPMLVGQIWLGGRIGRETFHKDHKLTGGPQMIQLSLDGKRLYVTNSLFSKWDDQFYPDINEKGSYMLIVNVDTDKGGLSLDKNFMVNFGEMKEGPFRAHEIRYPGGDCTSDIFLADQ